MWKSSLPEKFESPERFPAGAFLEVNIFLQRSGFFISAPAYMPPKPSFHRNWRIVSRPILQPIWESPPAQPDDLDRTIGRIVAEMVPDEATIQLGFGNLPNAVATQLTHHKNLGIHTEAFSPVMVELVKKGVINGKKKTLHPNKHVYSFALGDHEMRLF